MNKTIDKSRIPYLDNAKAILIMLVILGHVIQSSVSNYDDNMAFRSIYSFHMPLFFMISGYLANRGKYVPGLLQKRACQLLIPFVVWSFLPIYGITIEEALGKLMYPDRGLWFLYNLFFYSVMFNYAQKLKSKFKIPLLFGVGCFAGIMIVGMMFFHTKFNFTQLCYFFIFYAFGYTVKAYEPFVSKKYKNVTLIFGGILFLITIPFWMRRGNPLFYEYINFGGAVAMFYRYGVQVIGMTVFYILANRYLNNENAILSKIGKKTLGIYALNFWVISMWMKVVDLNILWLQILIVTTLAIPTCYFMTCMISKVKYLRLLLIGECRKI